MAFDITERVGFMVDSQQSKGYRVLSIFDRLMDGQGINKKQEALIHQVGEKTIQRDIDLIRAYMKKAKCDYHLQYMRAAKEYKLTNTANNRLSEEQVVAVVKILIASRTFLKAEMNDILDKLISLVATDPQKRNMMKEKQLYVDMHRNKSLLSVIWSISVAIEKHKMIEIEYVSERDTTSIQKILKPLAVIFSEYYFYLIAGDLDLPIVYRMDDIQHVRELDKNFQNPYANRFQEEAFRKRIQFMHTGELTQLRFLYKGMSPQVVLDRLPTAKLISQKDGAHFFEAEVFGLGIKTWLLSQGAHIEVMEPIELREEIIATIQTMQQNYRCI